MFLPTAAAAASAGAALFIRPSSSLHNPTPAAPATPSIAAPAGAGPASLLVPPPPEVARVTARERLR